LSAPLQDSKQEKYRRKFIALLKTLGCELKNDRPRLFYVILTPTSTSVMTRAAANLFMENWKVEYKSLKDAHEDIRRQQPFMLPLDAATALVSAYRNTRTLALQSAMTWTSKSS